MSDLFKHSSETLWSHLLKGTVEIFDPFQVMAGCFITGNDGHADAFLSFATTCNLGSIACAEFCISREPKTCEPFKYRALP